MLEANSYQSGSPREGMDDGERVGDKDSDGTGVAEEGAWLGRKWEGASERFDGESVRDTESDGTGVIDEGAWLGKKSEGESLGKPFDGENVRDAYSDGAVEVNGV